MVDTSPTALVECSYTSLVDFSCTVLVDFSHITVIDSNRTELVECSCTAALHWWTKGAMYIAVIDSSHTALVDCRCSVLQVDPGHVHKLPVVNISKVGDGGEEHWVHGVTLAMEHTVHR